MQSAKVKAVAIVIANLLYACTHLSALGIGKCIHDNVSNRIKADIIIDNPLMYAKCGSVHRAGAKSLQRI